MRKWLALLSCALLSWSGEVRAQPPETEMSPAARGYLAEALDIMRENSLRRFVVDWEALESAVFARAGGALEPADTHEAIRFALRELGDRHSYLIAPPTANGIGGGGPPAPPRPAGRVIDGRWAYVLIPTLGADSYADSLRNLVAELASESPCGWIVDLRENRGGNMWPMLLGIGPVLGDGTLGYFVDPIGDEQAWVLDGDRIGIDSLTIVATNRSLRLEGPSPPTAVLTGDQTASSGEAVAVAFRGRPRTRSFGGATAGLSTANYPFPLPDGAFLNLTISTFADRGGNPYGGPIEPDEPTGLAAGAVLDAAIAWLEGTASCVAAASAPVR
ncbi:MAG: S41 family peptidase [Gemmatimonadota bacterium]|nr:S41 family peptidase [Gemmatimonadota bacterium]